MDPSPHVIIDVNVRNLPESEETRSTVAMKVEKLVNEYIATPNGEPTLISSYESSPPQLFNFNIDSNTTYSEIFEILHDQHELSSQLSLILTSQIFRKADDMYLGRFATIIMNVVVKINYDVVLDIGVSVSDEEDKEDLVEKLVRDGAIGEDLGLEKESCSICLENLIEVSEKVPTRMPCSHLFHDCCIVQWLRRKDSCPMCRRVLLER